MNIQPDFEEFLRLLEDHGVDYMIIGGYAVAFHGFPRFTKDIDIFYEPSPANIEKLCRALVQFGFAEKDVTSELFAQKGQIITFGVPPVRIDLVNDVDGLTFQEARPNAVRGNYGRVPVTFIGLEDLLRNKRATPRSKDKADVEELE
jgi:predicted nucleotidyltransferase